jgi:rod shape-determining protein MreD
MKSKLVMWCLLYGLVAVFIQSTLLKLFAPGHMVVPNFVLILVSFLAFYEVSVLGTIIAFILGAQMDLASGLLLGPWCAGFVAVFGMLSSLSQRLFVESPVASFLAVFFASLLASFVYLILVLQFEPAGAQHFTFSLLLLLEAGLTALLAPVVFKMLKWLMLPKVRT